MATLPGTRSLATLPVFQGTAGNARFAYGSYTFAVNPTAADVVPLCRLPAGAVVLFGWYRGQDIDTGTGTLDIDIGWAANGGTTTPDAADPDGFGNFGAANGTAVANYLPEGGFLFPLHGTLATGPVVFTRETLVQATVVVAANAGGTGTIGVVIMYDIP